MTEEPDIAYIGILEESGILICNGLDATGGADYSDRSYYQGVMATKSFATGNYQISRSVGLPAINFAYPVLDDAGDVTRVVFAAMLAQSIGDFVSSLDLPEYSTVTVADEKGTILSRTPPDPQIIGNTELVQSAISALEDGVAEMYFDEFTQAGERDFVVSSEIPVVEGVRSGFVFLSIPEDVAFADVNRISRIANYSLLGFLVLAIVLATFGLEAVILKPIRKLITAANQLSTGDLSSRTGLRHGSDEIGQLANSFDGMASALEQREVQIAQVESRLSTMIESIEDGIISCSPNGDIRLFNQGAEKMFGYSADSVMNTSFTALFSDELLDSGGGLEQAVTPEIGLRQDGSTFPVEVSISRSDQVGTPDFTAIVRDISERQEALEAIERRAYFDIVTELPNRSRFVEEVQARITEMGTDTQPFVVFSAQISDLQSVEDNFGFDFAERLFGAFAERLTSNFGETCGIARLGPDEFAVLHLDRLVARNALGFARDVRELLEEPFNIDDEPVVVEIQVGAALHPGHGSDGEQLVHRASIASHAAESRPDRVMLFDPKLEESTQDRVRVLTGIRGALEHDELVFHYQPKVDIQNNRASDVEALMRWDSPERGLVPPGLFIPVVESSGYLWPVTAWGIGTAVEQLYRWNLYGHETSISVNVSARTFRNPQLLTTIESSLTLWGVDPGRLDIEITETAVMEDPELAEQTCATLRSMGLTISIDDFGVGQSPLVYLDRLPVNTIKVDRAFILKLGTSQKSDSIVESIIRLGRDLGLTVVAEGVEE